LISNTYTNIEIEDRAGFSPHYPADIWLVTKSHAHSLPPLHLLSYSLLHSHNLLKAPGTTIATKRPTISVGHTSDSHTVSCACHSHTTTIHSTLPYVVFHCNNAVLSSDLNYTPLIPTSPCHGHKWCSYPRD